MIASEGGAPAVAPGVTTGGTGVQTSVSSGLGFACTWAKMAADMETRAANVRTRETRMFIDGYENNTRKAEATSRQFGSRGRERKGLRAGRRIGLRKPNACLRLRP